jgi:integrase
MVLLLTLQRRGELGFAEWKEFDFDKRIWRIPDEHAKVGCGHTLPLSDWAIAELKVLKRMAGRSRFVLPGAHPDQPAEPKLITRRVARSLKRFQRVGVDAFTVHDLRRTGRTGLARLKVSRDIAERVLNHARDKIEDTYDVFDYLDEKRVALSLWGDYLRELKAQPRVQLAPEFTARKA